MHIFRSVIASEERAWQSLHARRITIAQRLPRYRSQSRSLAHWFYRYLFMHQGERKDVYKVYDMIAQWFHENRPQNLAEKSCLDNLISYLPINAALLDLGCGTGIPILQYLTDKNCNVTGVDASNEC